MKKLCLTVTASVSLLAFLLALFTANRALANDSAQSTSQSITAAPASGDNSSATALASKPGLIKRIARRLHLSAKPHSESESQSTLASAQKVEQAAHPKRLTEAEHAERQEEREVQERGGNVIKEIPPYHPDSAEGKAALSALTVASGFGEWIALGPSNFPGKVEAIAVDPNNSNNVYVAYEAGGLWGTRNGGQSWIPMFNQLLDTAFSSVAVHPKVAGLVAAGLIAQGDGYNPSNNQDVGISLSLDGGNTWTLIGPTNDPKLSVWEIGFGDATGMTIYAPTNKGLFKTTDQGQHWTKILAYDGQADFYNGRPSFAIDPLNSNILLLADRQVGVMRSTDAGATWTRVDTWVNPGNTGLSTILSWTSKTATVYAEAYSAYPYTEGKATYVSTNEGATWTAAATFSDSLDQGMYDMSIAADPFNPSHVLIHNTYFHSSTNGLQTISPQSGSPRSDALAITFDPNNQNVVYDGNDGGTYKSTDGGVTWTLFDVGTLTSKAYGGNSYAVGSDGSIIDDPQDYGIAQHLVPGVGWMSLPGYETKPVFINPQDPLDIYNCCFNGLFPQDGLSRLPTSGYPAAYIDPAPSEKSASLYALAFDPVSSDTLYFGKQNLYKSINRGASWTMLKSDTGINFVNVAPSNNQYIYTMNLNAGYLSYSTNGGTSWTQGFSLSGIGSINAVAVNPTNPTTLYVATSNGLYQSVDGGMTLSSMTGFPTVNAQYVVVDPASGNIFVSLGSTSGVLVSQDGGSTFQTLGTQLGLVAGVGGNRQGWLAIRNGYLYLGTSAGVYAIPTTATSACSETKVAPTSTVALSSAGTYPLEVFNVANCPLSPSNPQTWATLNTYGQTVGHANLSVTLTDNQAGSLRTDSITLGAGTATVVQLGGPNPAFNGSVVTIAQSGQCLTVPSGNAYSIVESACNAGSTAQQYTLRSAPSGGQAFLLSNAATGECTDIQGNGGSPGTFVGSYRCNSPVTANQTFTLQPQINGQWTIVANQLCLTVSATAGQLSACDGSAATLYTITTVAVAAPTFNPPAGNYATAQSVAISDTTAGAAIYYTTDGSTPTATPSELYSGPIAVSTAETINAIAVANSTTSPMASASYTFNAQQSQTITFPAPPSPLAYGVSPFALTATASSGLPVSYSTSGPGVITGSTLTVVGVGTITITASQAGNGTYSTAPTVTQFITVNPGILTVTANDASRAFGVANPAFTYTLTGFVNGDTPFVVGGTAKLKSAATSSSPAGTYPITFDTKSLIAANYTFNYVNGTLTVTSLKGQTITFAALPDKTFDAGSITVSASASSGLPVTFSAPLTPGTCTVSGNTVTFVSVGVCSVQADQAGNSTYAAAPAVVRTFSINRGTQKITFPDPGPQKFSDGFTAVSATASSGLDVTFTSLTTNVCGVTNLGGDSAYVNFVTTGTCTIQADQAGNNNYLAANPVTRSFQIK